MLPAGARLRRRDEFVTTLRVGRARRGRAGPAPAVLVAHLHAGQPAESATASTATARAGFVVSRSVGGAVVRNRVRRRLRHLVAARLGTLPPGSQLVVRALPGSAAATSTQLAVALDDALSVQALTVDALSVPASSVTDRGTTRP